MALTAAELLVRVGADTSEAEEKLGGFGGKMKSIMGGIAMGAVAGVGAAAAGLAGIVISGMGDAREAIAIGKQTEAVLKSTGGVAGMTAQSVGDLAQSLSRVTNYEDDAIQAGENMLLTFTNIGEDIFPQVTEMALDMSTAMGTDMTSSALQLGKALNDPAEGMAALTRVGVQFTKQQKAQIKAMTDAGNVAGAQAIILAELQREFGGSARAVADPVTQLTNAWSNFKEAAATAVIPVLNRLATAVMPALLSATEAIGPMLMSGMDALSEFGARAATVLGPAVDAIRGAWNAITSAFSQGEILGDWDALMPDWMLTLVTPLQNAAAALGETWTKIRTIFDNAKTAISSVWKMQTGNVIGAIADYLSLPEGWQTLVDNATTFIAQARAVFSDASLALRAVTLTQKGDIMGAVSAYLSLPEGWRTIVDNANIFIDAVQSIGIKAQAAFSYFASISKGDTQGALDALNKLPGLWQKVVIGIGAGDAGAVASAFFDSMTVSMNSQDWEQIGRNVGTKIREAIESGPPVKMPFLGGAAESGAAFRAAFEAKGAGGLAKEFEAQLTALNDKIAESSIGKWNTAVTQMVSDFFAGVDAEIAKIDWPRPKWLSELLDALGFGIKVPEDVTRPKIKTPSGNAIMDWLYGIVGSPEELQQQLQGKQIMRMGVAAEDAGKPVADLADGMKSFDRAMMITGLNVDLVTSQLLGNAEALKSNVAGALGDMGRRAAIPTIPVEIPPYQRPPIPTIRAEVPDFQAPAKEMEPPAWVTQLLGWADSLTTAPPWVTTLTGFADSLQTAPAWITMLSATTAILVATIPPWIPNLAGIIASLNATPDWIFVLSAVVGKLFASPAWVSTFRSAVDRIGNTPGWLASFNAIVDRLLAWSPPSMGGGGGNDAGDSYSSEGNGKYPSNNLGDPFKVKTASVAGASVGGGGTIINIYANGYSAPNAEQLAVRVARILNRRS